MKYRNVTLFFVITSLFLLFTYPHAVIAATGTTVKLTVPNLPSGD